MLKFKKKGNPQLYKPVFNNHKYLIFLLLLSLVIMFCNNTKFILFLKNGINFFIFPSQERLSNLLIQNKQKVDTFFSLLNTYNENIQLKEKLKNYNKFRNKIILLQQENKELRNSLNLNNKVICKLEHCKVIGRTIDEWYSAIIINKGEKYGISKGNVVISYDGEIPVLVGQVIEVYNYYSKVLLVTNMDSNIVAFIPVSNVYGLIFGENSKFLSMKNFENSENLKIGDEVITSGLGGIFPYGIYIGKIASIELSKINHCVLKATVQPSQKIYGLSVVSVIKKAR